jgi:hypothetical protein
LLTHRVGGQINADAILIQRSFINSNLTTILFFENKRIFFCFGYGFQEYHNAISKKFVIKQS